MPNQLSIAGANPGRQTKRTALFNARFSDGVYTLRGAMRDVSSRIEEHYYGSHNDSLTGDSSNVEITPKLTLARRFGNSVWNSNLWTDLNSFYDFRQFNANVEQIKTLVDTKTALYDATNNSQTPIWQKNPASTQSYMQSVGNNLFWGDGFDRKKWLTTLLSRVPYIYSDTEYNPYNFTPFELNSFIIDSNGDVEQLIGTVLQLSSFYILNGTIVFSLKNTLDGFNLPNAQQILEPGLQLYFSPTSEVSSVLGQTNGVTLTVQNLSGGISSASVYFGGSGGYLVGDTTSINQTSPTGGRLGQVQVASIGTSAGSGYTTASAIPTSTPGVGSGAVLSIVSDLSGGLASATISFGGLGYALGDIIYPLQSGGSKGYFKVSSVSGSAITGVALVTGVPKTVSVISAGTGYVSSQNVDTTGGTGSGLTLNIVDDESQFSVAYPYGGGAVTGFILDSPGTGYAVGDILVPLEPSSPAANGAELTITGISGAIGSLTFSSGGPTVVPYTTGAATWTTSGSGVGSTIAITSVSSGQITGVSFTPGSGFNVSDLIYITQGSATGAILEVASVTTNTATGLTFVSGGPTITAYTTGVPTWTTSGSGTGAAFNITAVTSGQVSGIAVTSGGSGFNIGDLINLTQGSATGAVLTVATVSGTTILTVNITTGGLTPYTTASNVSTTSSGSGTGAKINITGVTSGSINSGGWNLAAGGSGYTVGDHIYPTQGLASGASFTVSSVASNGILTVVIGAGGITPYTTGTNIATNTSGSGMGMTINITGVTSGSINSGGWSLNLGGTGYAIG